MSQGSELSHILQCFIFSLSLPLSLPLSLSLSIYLYLSPSLSMCVSLSQLHWETRELCLNESKIKMKLLSSHFFPLCFSKYFIILKKGVAHPV